MDFLEDLFDFGDRKRRKKGDILQRGEYYDGDYHGDHDDDHDHDHRQPYPANSYPQAPANSAAFQPGIICRKCSAQTTRGAKFCHACGTALEMVASCASCGSMLPADALFCPQCGSGHKNG